LENAVKSVLVAVELPDYIPDIQETIRLCETYGSKIGEVFYQKRREPDPAYFIGRGKVEMVREFIKLNGIELAIFDNTLTGSQLANLQDVLECEVLDRVELICRIFEKHATTLEGKLQTQYALLKVQLAKLKGRGVELSRLGGGIGTRGPGERQIERERRAIRKRLAALKKQLEEIEKNFETQSRRRRQSLATVALVGYTNAGKSTLFKRITNVDVLATDKLFATLSNKGKVVWWKGKKFFLVDTIGFIKNLPHELIDAFKATLKVVLEARVALLVLDIRKEREVDIVNEVLDDIGFEGRRIVALNKVDLLGEEEAALKIGNMKSRFGQDVIAISALRGEGVRRLLDVVVEVLDEGGL